MISRSAIALIAVALLLAGRAFAQGDSRAAETSSFKNPEWRMWVPLSGFDQYGGATLGIDGRMWLADQTGAQFVVFSENGKYTTVSTGSYFLERTARGPAGDIYGTTGYSPTIERFSPSSGKWTTFTLDQDANGAITAGPDGSIWIPEDSEIGRILPDGTIREYPLAKGDMLGGGTSTTQQMGGQVWFDAGTPGYSYYLASMRPWDGKITKHFEDLCGEYVLPTVAAPDGLVWAVCDGHFDGFDDRGVVEHVTWPADLGFGMVGAYNNALIGPDNAIWIAGENVVNGVGVSGAFLRFDLVTHKFDKFVPPNDGYEWCAAFTFDPAGNIWGGTDNGQVQEVVIHH